jgi:phthiocerol/phenolphthiocerol synthesis type-I polyketide synthase C
MNYQNFIPTFGELHAGNFSVDWKSIYPNIGEFVQLPNYAWQKERYWFDQQPEFVSVLNCC